MSETKHLRVLFDGTEILETPIGWQDITDVIKRVKDTQSLFVTCEAPLIFKADGYDYLIDVYNSGFCNTVEVELQQFVRGYYRKFFTGIIFIRTAVIDRKNCTIEVKIEDNSFYAKIENNRAIEAFPFGERSKNNIALTACPYVQVDLFRPVDGVYEAIDTPPYSNAAYTFYDLFAYMIAFDTDGAVEFDSTLFGPGGEYAGLVLTCGAVLRQSLSGGTTEADFKSFFQKISFDKLFTEAKKKANIGMYVDISGALPKVRIERIGDIRTSNVIFQADGIDEILEKIAEDELYATVRIGSNTTLDSGATSFPEDITAVGYKNEQLLILGECNLESELNLVSDWIIDHNIIEDCFINGSTDYDTEHIIIMCDAPGGAVYTAQQNNIEDEAGVFPVYYNQALNGINVLDNYENSIPAGVAQYLGVSDNTFSATHNVDYQLDDYTGSTSELIPFNTDVSDPNALWDGQYYSVPTSGLYTFAVAMTIGAGQAVLDYEIFIDRLDPGLVLLGSREIFREDFLQYGTQQVNASGSITADAGDFIRIRIRYQLTTAFTPTPGVIYAGAAVECTGTVDGGGVYKRFDPENYPIINHIWEYPLTYAEFNNIARNQTGQIEFWRDGETHYSGWIDSVKFKRFSNEKAQFVTYRAVNIPVVSNAPFEIRQVHFYGSLTDIPYTVDTDFYSDPFSQGTGIYRVLFYTPRQDVTVTIPSTHMAAAIGAPCIIVGELNMISGITTVYNFNTVSATFTIRPDCNYTVRFVYDMAGAGNTFFIVVPTIVAPVTAGANGSVTISIVAPAILADYSFLWSTGATTQGINAPAGNYWCDVTYIPGTFDTNTLRFNVNIPISETGD